MVTVAGGVEAATGPVQSTMAQPVTDAQPAAEATASPSAPAEREVLERRREVTIKAKGEGGRTRRVTISSGTCSNIGIRRSTNEDTFLNLQEPLFNQHAAKSIQVDPSSPQRSLLAIFDGHKGVECANFCRDRLASNVIAASNFGKPDCLEDILKEAIEKTDKEFLDSNRSLGKSDSAGSTAIVFFMQGDQVAISNTGDSRAVLCRCGHTVPLSKDHNPSLKSEVKRIKENGGMIGYNERDALARSKRNWLCNALFSCCLDLKIGTPYIFPGGIAVSRSMGDLKMKDVNILIATPDVTSFTLMEGDEFIILACDGLWDVIPSEVAVRFIRSFRKSERPDANDPAAAAQALVNCAIGLRSKDNITVQVIYFGYPARGQ
ncbi:unnamed protein product (mitochondrion) [Plasmodiophora brassicae]|uniref:PPM-type phosphatase domain-containing protein n=1 Tax=Plasmodiophora brassicae TaxID=37360 RepID=A0A3P3Y606_PLABS|nr:unnamed protein product [Plasmodiophora brassicae]